MVEIFEMSLEDFYQIEKILDKDFDSFWSASIFKSELESKNSKYFVAKEDNNIVGFAGIWYSPVDVEITNIVTKKTERKKGIGSLLLEKLLEEAEKSKRESISLEVNENNLIAQRLYEKYGFEVIGKRKKYYNGKDDAIIMTKYF